MVHELVDNTFGCHPQKNPGFNLNRRQGLSAQFLIFRRRSSAYLIKQGLRIKQIKIESSFHVCQSKHVTKYLILDISKFMIR